MELDIPVGWCLWLANGNGCSLEIQSSCWPEAHAHGFRGTEVSGSLGFLHGGKRRLP